MMSRSADDASPTGHASRDAICGLVTLVVAVLYYLGAKAVPESMLADAIGPSGLPIGYAAVLAALSIMLIGRSLLGRSSAAGKAAAPANEPGAARPRRSDGASFHDLARAAGVLAIGAAYVLALPAIGYPLGIALLISAMVLYQGGKAGRSLVLVAAGGAVLLWLIFAHILHVPVPTGLWPSILS